jgi:hypothetical protein
MTILWELGENIQRSGTCGCRFIETRAAYPVAVMVANNKPLAEARGLLSST